MEKDLKLKRMPRKLATFLKEHDAFKAFVKNRKEFARKCPEHKIMCDREEEVTIINSFTWLETKEGDDYWIRLYNIYTFGSE
jgi:hypothetical protein